jgi:hypothetical protein
MLQILLFLLARYVLEYQFHAWYLNALGDVLRTSETRCARFVFSNVILSAMRSIVRRMW